jgi:hypothetical protein
VPGYVCLAVLCRQQVEPLSLPPFPLQAPLARATPTLTRARTVRTLRDSSHCSRYASSSHCTAQGYAPCGWQEKGESGRIRFLSLLSCLPWLYCRVPASPCRMRSQPWPEGAAGEAGSEEGKAVLGAEEEEGDMEEAGHRMVAAAGAASEDEDKRCKNRWSSSQCRCYGVCYDYGRCWHCLAGGQFFDRRFYPQFNGLGPQAVPRLTHGLASYSRMNDSKSLPVVVMYIHLQYPNITVLLKQHSGW